MLFKNKNKKQKKIGKKIQGANRTSVILIHDFV